MIKVFESQPTEIRLNKDKNELKVAFDTGENFTFTAEFLRVMSPSAEVRGHAPSQRKTVPGKKNVTITAIEEVGHYAIKIVFEDGHDTGIYSWRHLHEIGTQQDNLWKAYLEELAQKGLSR